MKKIKFGKAAIEGYDYLVTRVEENDDVLVVYCADAYQVHRIEIPETILTSSAAKKEIRPKYRDRLTLFRVGLNDGCSEDDFENRHFFSYFLLAARINGHEWLRVPEHKAFSIPFDSHVV